MAEECVDITVILVLSELSHKTMDLLGKRIREFADIIKPSKFIFEYPSVEHGQFASGVVVKFTLENVKIWGQHLQFFNQEYDEFHNEIRGIDESIVAQVFCGEKPELNVKLGGF